mgnify:CR=1 FL=1
MKSDDIPPRSFRVVCQSGDSTAFTVPTNMLGYISEIEVDSRAQSGQLSTIGIDIRDTFTPQGGSSTTQVRKSFGIRAGEVVGISLDAPVHVIGQVDLRCNWSGPIVSLTARFE